LITTTAFCIGGIMQRLAETAHPLKDQFKNIGVTQCELSHYLGIGYHRLHKFLNGYTRMPAWLESKLNLLLDELKMKAQNN
jgi:hypothetical protein